MKHEEEEKAKAKEKQSEMGIVRMETEKKFAFVCLKCDKIYTYVLSDILKSKPLYSLNEREYTICPDCGNRNIHV